jgi:hypothetical protein
MRTLSFLFAALLGIALALISPALAGPGVTTAQAVAGPAVELDASLIADLGLDQIDPVDFSDAA